MAEDLQKVGQWLGLPNEMMQASYAIAKQTLDSLAKQTMERWQTGWMEYAERLGIYNRAVSELGAFMLASQARATRIGFERLSQFLGICVVPLMNQAAKDEEESIQKLVEEIMKRAEAGGKGIG